MRPTAPESSVRKKEVEEMNGRVDVGDLVRGKKGGHTGHLKAALIEHVLKRGGSLQFPPESHIFSPGGGNNNNLPGASLLK